MFIIGSIRIPVEAAFWLLALFILGFFGTELHGHYSFCIPTQLGLDGCMGCGIGHSISMALRGDFKGAFLTHPMGIPAIGILVYRSISLIRKSNK